MTINDLAHLEITELSRLIQRREVSPVELTRHMLERINRLDPDLHAFATLTPELAYAQAADAEARLEKRQYLGPLHGVPIALKDLCYTKGVRTAAGMPIHQDFLPAYDGTAARRLREAGAFCTDRGGAALRFNNPHPALDGVLAAGQVVHGLLRDALHR